MSTYWAAPNGSGTGLAASSPFTIAAFWNVARAGDILNLLGVNPFTDGLYQGPNNIIRPPIGMSGTGSTWPPADGQIAPSSSPITIQAVNDGGVLIDGQFSLIPVRLNTISWFVLQGFNVRNSQNHVMFLEGNNQHNIFRRIVAWDASAIQNGHVLFIVSSPNNLFEDIGLFGTGRNVVNTFGSPNTGNIARRLWARWEGTTEISPKISVQTSYAGDGLQCENCLSTWTAESLPQVYNVAAGGTDTGSQLTGWNAGANIFGLFRTAMNAGECAGIKLFGSLGYMKAASSGQPSARGSDNPSSGYSFTLGGCEDFRHVMAFISPSYAKFTSVKGFDLNRDTGTSTMDHFTSVRNSDSILNWTTSNGSTGTSLGAVANPWTTTGAGANLCFRWVNGVVTTTPLWPWLMNDRIKAATAGAGGAFGTAFVGNAGNNGNPCFSCSGVPAARTATDVTADIQALLGTIPSQCFGGGGGTPPPPPSTPPSQNLTISNSGGGGSVGWTASKLTSWLTLSASSGVTPATISLTANPTGLAASTYHDTVSVTVSGADNTPQTAAVTFTVGGSPTISAAQDSANHGEIDVSWANVVNPLPADVIRVVDPSGVVADSFSLGSPPGYVIIIATGPSGSLQYATWSNAALTYAFQYVQSGVVVAASGQVSIVLP